jgi:putative colanic acid biosynthesis UDP-glucose lipid carrier transferase
MTAWVRSLLNGDGTGTVGWWSEITSYEVQKRLFDVVGGILLLLPSLPVMFCIAVFIKAVSRGPVVFAQKRVGLAGNLFVAYKFRSMHECAGGSLDQIAEDDDRIIWGGWVWRSPRRAALGQLVIVVGGDMSLVGPGPRPDEVDRVWSRVDRSYLDRRLVRPGITGPAQLVGRSHTPEEKRVTIALEREYLKNWSVWRDFKILVQTVPVVLLRKGV